MYFDSKLLAIKRKVYIYITYTIYMTYKTEVLKNLPDDNEISSIRATKGTKRLIRSMGFMGESEEDVIKRLMFKKATGVESEEKPKYIGAI